VKTGKTVIPLGIPSLVKEVDPSDAKSKLLPDVTYSPLRESIFISRSSQTLTAEKGVNVTPLPHAYNPLLMPQLPLEETIVKLEFDPEIVKVARVCVDHVPRERRPPTAEPD
jgi:hypothetical protein